MNARVLAITAALLVACGAKKTNIPPPAPPAPVCGNGVVETGETCDEGAANGTQGGHCKADCSGLPKKVSIDGDVFAFFSEVKGPRLQDVQVSVLEHPEIIVDAGVDAHFHIDGLYEGDDVTMVATQSTIVATQTATYTLGPNGMQPFSMQVVPTTLFNALSGLLPQPPALDQYCAIATTVARMGGSLFAAQRQGMPDVTVALDPPVAPSSGPIYFSTSVLPDTTLTATTIDGGVLFYRVPPGKYLLKASKNGVVFNSVRINCTIGALINAAPPMGPLANVSAPDYAKGLGRADDSYSASTDALCDQTATCVNGSPSTNAYPAATQASCKAMFRNMWSYVDPDCDASTHVRDAAQTFFACRGASCTNALGDDTVCASEDTAFRTAEAAYGACVAAK
ncbi:MAG: hypothetical protein JST54_20485 [Deltaproteobacteria bacterium]|nr:hypothetical protein [Deltaproteobacteria bacterium]